LISARSSDLSSTEAEPMFAKPLRVEELARLASMGVSTLHHHFRMLTSMSPLQYQKQLRLQSARNLMMNNGLDAASAAFEVGYESTTQFNREYSRFFGQPPIFGRCFLQVLQNSNWSIVSELAVHLVFVRRRKCLRF